MIVALATTSRRPAPDESKTVDEVVGIKGPRHAYLHVRADPQAAAPTVRPEHLHLLSSSAQRRALGTGDARPMVMRPGATEHHQHPSRAGNRLRWPDGRLTDLAGAPIAEAP